VPYKDHEKQKAYLREYRRKKKEQKEKYQSNKNPAALKAWNGIKSRCKNDARYWNVRVLITKKFFIDLYNSVIACYRCGTSFEQCKRHTHRTTHHYDTGILFVCQKCHNALHRGEPFA
jgi:hypothetical protein